MKEVIFGEIGEYKVNIKGEVYCRLKLYGQKKNKDRHIRSIVKKWRKLKQAKPTRYSRYMGVMIFRDGKYRKTPTHVIVASAFLGDYPIGRYVPGMVINHKNNKKHDNRLSNLEIVTHKENMEKSSEHRRIMKSKHIKKLNGIVKYITEFLNDYTQMGQYVSSDGAYYAKYEV